MINIPAFLRVYEDGTLVYSGKKINFIGATVTENNGIVDVEFSAVVAETDPIFSASAAAGISGTDISHWNTAYGWGNHASANYKTNSMSTARILGRTTAGTGAIEEIQIGSGLSLSGGVLSATVGAETDPIFSASAAAGISGTDISHWNTAYGWGNHALAGYLTSYTDEKVKVSNTDTTAGKLWDKIQVNGELKRSLEGTPNEYLNLYLELDTVSVNSNTSLTSSHRIVLLDSTSGNIILTLPDTSTLKKGHSIHLKDIGGAAHYNTIQVGTYSISETIDGATTAILELAYGSLNLMYQGSSKWIITSKLQSYILYDSGGQEAVNFYGRVLKYNGGTALDWSLRTLVDSAAITSMDWENKTLHDDYAGSVSIDYGNHKLKDTSGYARFDWQSGEMRDGGNVLSLDLAYRQLYNTSGTLLLDYSNALKFSGLTTNGVLSVTNGDGTVAINDKIIADGTAAVIGQTMTGIRSNAILIGKSNTQTLGIAGATSGVIVGTSNSDARGAAIIVGNSNTASNSGGAENYTTVLMGYNNSAGNQRSGGFGVSLSLGNANSCWAFGYGLSHSGGNSVSLGQNMSGVAANNIWIGLGTTTKVIIDSSGKMILGNGVSSATYDLEIYAVTNSNATLRIKAPTSGNAAGIILDGGSTSNPYLNFYRGGSPTFQIRSNNSGSFSIYSYLSAPNAESFSIAGTTHAATFAGTITSSDNTIDSTSPTLTFKRGGTTKSTINVSTLDNIKWAAASGGANIGFDLAGRHYVGNAGTSTAALFVTNVSATGDRVLLLKHIASGTGHFIEGYDSTNTTKFSISSAGLATFNGLTLGDATNFAVGSSTGTKIGTATTQKLGFWNATPIVQPTTAVAAATFVANTSLIADDSATFDGYTIGQIVKALRNTGILA